MPTCYFLPGLASSTLETAQTLYGRVMWVNTTRLALCEFFGMALDADGLSPRPGDGQECFALGPLTDYTTQIIDRLRTGLLDHGYTVFPWGYDSRKKIETHAGTLANHIRTHASPADPCSIVAHSMGGLVARRVWAMLNFSGESALIRRIVTLGTPHGGSYGIPAAWSFSHPLLFYLVVIKQAVAGFSHLGGQPDTVPQYTTADLVRVLATWPGAYELLPHLDDDSNVDDPFRAVIYDASRWPGDRGVQQQWLDWSAGPWQTLLANPGSLPPYKVLTTVAGQGFPTIARLSHPEALGDPAAFGLSEIGDGLVMLGSALRPSARQHIVFCEHSAMLASSRILDPLPGWVLEEREPVFPVPPPEVDRGTEPVAAVHPPGSSYPGRLATGPCVLGPCPQTGC